MAILENNDGPLGNLWIAHTAPMHRGHLAPSPLLVDHKGVKNLDHALRGQSSLPEGISSAPIDRHADNRDDALEGAIGHET